MSVFFEANEEDKSIYELKFLEKKTIWEFRTINFFLESEFHGLMK